MAMRRKDKRVSGFEFGLEVFVIVIGIGSLRLTLNPNS
jgi:hypothetical protein